MKSLTLLLLCLASASYGQSPIAARLRARAPIITKPPNTNTYQLHPVWTQVPFADSYLVYCGPSPSNLALLTNVVSTGAVITVWATNARPWVAVSAMGPGGVSDYTFVTQTDYFNGSALLSQDATTWTHVPGSDFTVLATNTGGLFRIVGVLSNNFPHVTP